MSLLSGTLAVIEPGTPFQSPWVQKIFISVLWITSKMVDNTGSFVSLELQLSHPCPPQHEHRLMWSWPCVSFKEVIFFSLLSFSFVSFSFLKDG